MSNSVLWESLDLSNNKIQTISNIENFSYLKYLSLSKLDNKNLLNKYYILIIFLLLYIYIYIYIIFY